MLINQIDEIIKEFYPNFGSKVCIEKTGKSRLYISNRARMLGVKVNKDALRMIHCNRVNINYQKIKRNVRDDEISKPNTSEASYLLGLIWGDGWLNNTGKNYSTCFQTTDDDCIDIIPVFNHFGKWTVYSRIRKNRKTSTCIKTSNKPLYDFLYFNDYKDKTFLSPNKILSCVPRHLHYMWWRGYSDADGCFYQGNPVFRSKYSITGHIDLDWSCFSELMSFLNIKYGYARQKKIFDNGKVHARSRVSITGRENLKKWIDYLYPDNYLYMGLSRKYEKSKVIKDWCYFLDRKMK